MQKGGKGGGGGGKKGGGHNDKGQSYQSHPPPQPQWTPPPVKISGSGIASWSYGMTSKGGPNEKGGDKGGGKGGPMMGGGGGYGMGKGGGKGMQSFGGGGGYGKGDGMDQNHSNVFVGNLQEGTTQASLEAAYAPYGKVNSCFMATKEGRSFGFVKFATVDSALRAIAALNGQSGWIVKLANKDMNSEGGGGGGKGGGGKE